MFEQLFVANGHTGDASSVTEGGFGIATDDLVEIAAVGQTGATPAPNFLQ